MKNIKGIINIIILLLIVGCSNPSKLDRKQFMRFMTDESNGLVSTKQVGNVIYQLRYDPINLKILNKIKNRVLTEDEYNEEVNRYKGSQYFVFKIKLKNGNGDLLKYEAENGQQYSERVNYFSFQMQNDFYLMSGKDSLKCKLFHFERSFDASPYCTFLLGFDSNDKLINSGTMKKEKVQEDKIFVYNDRVFGAGPIKYKIKATDINNIPELTIQYDVK